MNGAGGTQTERQVQRAILQMCQTCFPRVLLHHSPNGAHLAGSDTARAMQMGAMLGDGLRKGFPDLLAIWPGGVAFIEVKCSTGGVVSPAQKAMHETLAGMGHAVAVVTSTDEAFDFLRDRGAPWSGVPWRSLA